jgi:hypothetical protein
LLTEQNALERSLAGTATRRLTIKFGRVTKRTGAALGDDADATIAGMLPPLAGQGARDGHWQQCLIHYVDAPKNWLHAFRMCGLSNKIMAQR